MSGPKGQSRLCPKVETLINFSNLIGLHTKVYKVKADSFQHIYMATLSVGFGTKSLIFRQEVFTLFKIRFHKMLRLREECCFSLEL